MDVRTDTNYEYGQAWWLESRKHMTGSRNERELNLAKFTISEHLLRDTRNLCKGESFYVSIREMLAKCSAMPTSRLINWRENVNFPSVLMLFLQLNRFCIYGNSINVHISVSKKYRVLSFLKTVNETNFLILLSRTMHGII